MTTFLPAIVSIFMILATISLLVVAVAICLVATNTEGHESDRHRRILLVAGAIAITALTGAEFVRSTEPVQWSLTEEEGTYQAYRSYLDRFPEGKYLSEAQTGLDKFPLENASVRKNMLQKMIALNKQDTIGAKILDYFVKQPINGSFEVSLNAIRKSNLSPVYGSVDWFPTREPFETFCRDNRLGLDIEEKENPPFNKFTILVEYWVEPSGVYQNERSAGTVPGVLFRALVRLYKPEDNQPTAEYKLGSHAVDKMSYRESVGSTKGTEETMEGLIWRNAKSNFEKELNNHFDVSQDLGSKT